MFKADSDIDMLCDIAVTSPAVGVAARDAAAPLSCDRHDTDHGRALLPPLFLRSVTYSESMPQPIVMYNERVVSQRQCLCIFG